MTDPTNDSTITVGADFSSIRKLGPWLSELAPSLPLGEVELALQELVVNIIEHAYECDGSVESADGRTIDVTVHIVENSDGMEIITADAGRPLADQNSVRPQPDQPQVGGYGLMIVEQLTSAMSYERSDELNVWHLRFDSASNPPSDRGHR